VSASKPYSITGSGATILEFVTLSESSTGELQLNKNNKMTDSVIVLYFINQNSKA
jgi:hypothetical protein